MTSSQKRKCLKKSFASSILTKYTPASDGSDSYDTAYSDTNKAYYRIHKFYYHNSDKLLFLLLVLVRLRWGPPGGYWIPISREKIRHIPESRGKFSIFPIPNFHHRYPVEYFCSRLRALFKTVIIEQPPKILYKDMIGALQKVLDLNFS